MRIVKKIKKTYHTYHAYEKVFIKTTHWYLMEYHGNEQLIPQIKERITKAVWQNRNEDAKTFFRFYESLKDLIIFI